MNASALRVIVVGRTGLEGTLRRDDGIELIRAGNILDAIGELNDPIDRKSPTQAVVILGPESEPEAVGLTTQGLIASLREIDPNVRVLGVARSENPARTGPPIAPLANGSTGLDGRVSTHCDGAELRDLVMRRVSEAAPASATTAPRSSMPTQTHDAPGASGSLGSFGVVASATRTVPLVVVPVDSAAGTPSHWTSATIPPLSSSPSPATPAVGPDGASQPARDPMQPQLGLSADAYAAWLNAEAALLRAMLDGRPIRPMLMARVRELLGADATLDESPGAGGGEIVAGDGRVFGVLKTSAASDNPALRRAVSAWLGAILASQAQCERLARDASTDELTGAFNRRYFERYVTQAAELAKKSRASFCVLLLDADNFKYYNDKYGHGAGDEILIELVRLLTTTIRPNDRVCRIGGDELAIVLFDPEGPRIPGSQQPLNAWQVVRRFQQRVSEHAFPKLSAHAPGTLTVSGGLSTFPWDGLTAADLLHAADERLLQAKREGKDRIVMGEKA